MTGKTKASLRAIAELLPVGRTYRIGKELTGANLGEWPVYSDPAGNLRKIARGCYADPPYDENGIVRVRFDGKIVENPGTVALVALNAWHAMLRRRKIGAMEELFLRHADWLVDRLDVDERGVGRWWYTFSVPGRSLGAAWVSCFAQGLGVSVLLRAAQHTGDDAYLHAARRAAGTFRLPLAEAGVLYREDGLTFFEEYPEKPPSHVLNGFITALLCLWEYSRVTNDQWSEELFRSGAGTLAEVLVRYETAGGLRYDLATDELLGGDYVHFITAQLRAMRAITHDRTFSRRARRWKRRYYLLGLKKLFSRRS